MKIKKIVKNMLPKSIKRPIKIKRFKDREYKRLNRSIYTFNDEINIIEIDKNYINGINKILSSCEIEYKNEFYFYTLDYKTKAYSEKNIISNMPIDYSLCMFSINKLRKMSKNINNSNKIFDIIESYINRCISKIKDCDSENKERIYRIFSNLTEKDASNFDEALQRILIYNQILWQTGHELVGLGRLDNILIKYYEKDIKNKIITKDEAFKMIKEFLIILNRDYCYKSSSLLGDTGQLIILGGYKSKNEYLCNDLTYMFIDAIEKLQIPDPKVLVRVSYKTPKKLYEKSLNCIKTGIGCPLLSNDEVVIKALNSSYYDEEDSYNYVTSACWEPLIVGKSFDQNNLINIEFLEPLNRLSKNIKNFKSYEELIEKYDCEMKKYLDELVNELNKLEFQEDIIMSILNNSCLTSGKDISKGGAKYNNYGLLSLGLSDTVDSLLLIKKYVFDDKSISIDELNAKRINEQLSEYKIKKGFGSDSEEIIDLTNRIMDMVSSKLSKYVNNLGGSFKFGLSSPGYISNSNDKEATFNGKKANTPYSVHISSNIPTAYTELIKFAGSLDYCCNKYNGNVVDFVVPPSFIEDNYDKFLSFLEISTKVGYFQMQMNVVSSKTLIEAKKDPEKFPNLIVRVWGFSAYFNDLPEEYKDVLINRAKESENSL